MEYLQAKINKAVDVALECGQFDGSHHKMWVIDQMLRALLDTSYEEVIDSWNEEAKNYDADEWDVGIAP